MIFLEPMAMKRVAMRNQSRIHVGVRIPSIMCMQFPLNGFRRGRVINFCLTEVKSGLNRNGM